MFRNLMKICNQLVKNVKKCVFLDRTLCGQIQYLQGAKSILENGQKRAKPKFWSQQVLFGTKLLKFGPKRVNLATQTPMYSTVNCTSATSYNNDATITFFLIAQQ